jgi:acetoin utilization protein AcuB
MIGHRKEGRHVYCVKRETDITRALAIMVEKNIRHLPVVDEKNRLIGIVSDRDLRTAMPLEAYRHLKNGHTPGPVAGIDIETVMTREPHCISTAYTLQDTLYRFKEVKVGAFPIVDENNSVVGIISDRDLLHGFIDVLGVGSPGSFLGLIAPPSTQVVGQIVSRISEAKIAIASMLVIKAWEDERQAIFLYLLTQNIRHARQLVTDMGYELIDPLQWFFYRHMTDITDSSSQ